MKNKVTVTRGTKGGDNGGKKGKEPAEGHKQRTPGHRQGGWVTVGVSGGSNRGK